MTAGARHGARAALGLGLAASLAGNVIAAHPTALGRLVAAWPPLALLVAIELVTRIPGRGGALSVLRLASAGLLAVIAAWVSYWHLVELARAAGEGMVAAHLLPLSVDGLVAVASVCLRELGAAAPVSPAPATATNRRTPAATSPPAAPIEPTPALAVADPTEARLAVRAGAGELVRRLAAEHPEWTQAELAAAAGCSSRTVRRHLSTASGTGTGQSLEDELAELTADPEPSAEPQEAVVLPDTIEELTR